MTDTSTWTCPNNPFSHDWDGGLTCRSCDATRTADEALTSLLAGMQGWDRTRAAALVKLHRTEVLAEAEATLTARHCSPESVALTHHLINDRLCTTCQGYGQTVKDTDDGGIVRRCRDCNGHGLRAATHSQAVGER